MLKKCFKLLYYKQKYDRSSLSKLDCNLLDPFTKIHWICQSKEWKITKICIEQWHSNFLVNLLDSQSSTGLLIHLMDGQSTGSCSQMDQSGFHHGRSRRIGSGVCGSVHLEIASGGGSSWFGTMMLSIDSHAFSAIAFDAGRRLRTHHCDHWSRTLQVPLGWWPRCCCIDCWWSGHHRNATPPNDGRTIAGWIL